MAEIDNKVESGEGVESGVDYIETIKQLKENTVSKDQYNKLKEENSKLLKSLVNGETIEQEKPKEIDVKGIEKKLRTENNRIKNIEYAQMLLDLREADLAAGKPDPFLSPANRNPSEEDLAQCQKVADAFAYCIEYAEGDPESFTNELQKIMVDVPMPRKKK